jgi:hypothetical protein
MKPLGRSVRALIIAVGVAALLFGAAVQVRRAAYRRFSRQQARYHAEMVELGANYEKQLMEKSRSLKLGVPSLETQNKVVSEVFELLRNSSIMSNRRDVDGWRVAAPSPRRTALALKWAEEGAKQAAQDRKYHADARRMYNYKD